MNRRYLIVPATVLAAVALPLTANAHTPNVADSCTGLAVTLTQYEGSSPNNRVTVTIDGATQTFDFGGSFTKSFPWSQTSAHSWSVVIDANRTSGNPTLYDKTFTGTEQPCQEPSTTTTSTPTTTTQPAVTTTSPPTTDTQPTTTTPAEASSTTTSTTTTVPSPSSVPPTTIPNPTDPTTPPTTLSPLSGNLPETGAGESTLIVVAAVVLLAGCALILATRRQP